MAHDSLARHSRLDPSKADSMLPGPLQIRRRAPELYALQRAGVAVMDELRWLNCYALAVMEENACMGRLVTAPTNGAAGVVPAVLAYYMRHLRPRQPDVEKRDPATFLLTAATVGVLAKERRSVSSYSSA